MTIETRLTPWRPGMLVIGTPIIGTNFTDWASPDSIAGLSVDTVSPGGLVLSQLVKCTDTVDIILQNNISLN